MTTDLTMVAFEPPKTIFIDFDGTLVDSLSVLYNSYSELLENFGQRATSEEFSSLNGPALHEIVAILKLRYKWHDSDDEISKLYDKILLSNYEKVRPFSDSEDFLSTLSKLKMTAILVTSSPARLCEPNLKRLGWNSYFENRVYGDTVIKSKPHPDIYLKAIKLSDRKREEVIAIEDSINGIKSAHSAGLRVFAVNSHVDNKELVAAGASRVFTTLTATLDNISVK